MKQKGIALYFGSFDPFHVGHMNIREKASKIFETVKIVKLRNISKRDNFPISRSIDIQYGKNPIGLIEHFEKDWNKVIIIRGIRNKEDYEFEHILYTELIERKPDLNIVYIFSDPEYKNISSSWLKALREVEDIKKYLI